MASVFKAECSSKDLEAEVSRLGATLITNYDVRGWMDEERKERTARERTVEQ